MIESWPARLMRGLAVIAVCALLSAPPFRRGGGSPLGGRRGHLSLGCPCLRERNSWVSAIPAYPRWGGTRPASIVTAAADWACARDGCRSSHRIAGRYLFYPCSCPGDDLDLPFVETMRADRDPYTEATLARAIRDGVAADGRPLGALMPRFEMDDAAMADLIAYLRTLAPKGGTGSQELGTELCDDIYARCCACGTQRRSRCAAAVLCRQEQPHPGREPSITFLAPAGVHGQSPLGIARLATRRQAGDLGGAIARQACRGTGVRRHLRHRRQHMGASASILRIRGTALSVSGGGSSSRCGKRFR